MREAATLCPRDLDLQSGVQVTCDMGYLCANFGLPRPVRSRLRPNVRDKQTDVRQQHRLMPPPRGRGIIIVLPKSIRCFDIGDVAEQPKSAAAAANLPKSTGQIK